MHVCWYSVGFHTQLPSVAGTYLYIHINNVLALSKPSTAFNVKSGQGWLLLSPKTLTIVTGSKDFKISKANEIGS
jgi:hypothetical protein